MSIASLLQLTSVLNGDLSATRLLFRLRCSVNMIQPFFTYISNSNNKCPSLLSLDYCHIRESSLTALLHLVPRGDLLVALLDAGAGHGGEELRLPDTVGEVVHSSPVAAQTWTVGMDK